MLISLKVVAFSWILGAIAAVHLGDSSIAAIVAAVASVFNAYMVIHAHGVQSEIRADLKLASNDTSQRGRQIIELRSLSEDRERQINRLERIADRFAAFDLQDVSRRIKKIEKSVTPSNDNS